MKPPALADLGKDANIYIYEGVGHTFADPSDQNYATQSAEDAWDKTLGFFSAA
ncbi:MAG: dienelactone hydrolase family protein [Cyanobacteria bacterium P01_D01_bin.44]